MRIRRQPKEERPDKAKPIARIRRSRHNRPEPGQVKMIVLQGEGRILGWEMPSGEFVPIGQDCCQNPFECKKCFGPRGAVVASPVAPVRTAAQKAKREGQRAARQRRKEGRVSGTMVFEPF